MASSSIIHSAHSSSSRPSKYDIFLSFRGEDTRKTYVDHLYSSLKQRGIVTYKDSETLPRGESIGPSLFKAIEESYIALIIFSKNYAGSSWCLDELAHIMKCEKERGLIVLPIYYDVDPSDVRKQKGDFGEAFAQQVAANISKAHIWRYALADVSNIAGWETKNMANGHESKGIKQIVDEVAERLLLLNADFDEDLVGLLSDDEGMQLFNKHAYNKNIPIEGYEPLSKRIVSYAAGLPLSLKVLGSFLKNKDKMEWMSTLNRLEDIPKVEITSKLKVSYDGLKTIEKELFLDVACFWRGELIKDAMEVFEAFGYHPRITMDVLRRKGLIIIDEDGRFDMHDLVQEMGHHVARGENLKHSRVWDQEQIRNLCLSDQAILKDKDKLEAIKFNNELYDRDLSSTFSNVVSNMKNLRWLSAKSSELANGPTFLSNKLRYLRWSGYPASSFPDHFQPTKLVVLKLHSSMLRNLWTGYKHLPHLKELSLSSMFKLGSTVDFDGPPSLQVLRLMHCELLEEIHPSLGEHRGLRSLTMVGCPIKRFPAILHMHNLEALEIVACDLEDGEIPRSIGELFNLQELDLRENHFSRLDFSLSDLTRLKVLNLSRCKQLVELPDLPTSLAILKAENCLSLESFGDYDKSFRCLREVSLRRSGIIKDGIRLLQYMLQGGAVEKGSMILNLAGVEVADGFRPNLFRGSKYRLQLPENWFDDFRGFLICAAVPSFFDANSLGDKVRIVMKQVMSEMDSEDAAAVVWKRSASDGKMETWVRYVSFSSLKDTAWWNRTRTYVALEFTILSKTPCVGVGVSLVRMETSEDSSTVTEKKYTLQIKVHRDEASALTISLPPGPEYDFDHPTMHFSYGKPDINQPTAVFLKQLSAKKPDVRRSVLLKLLEEAEPKQAEKFADPFLPVNFKQ